MKKNKDTQEYTALHLLDDQTPFAVREAFNQLRTNLMYVSTAQDGCPIFAITSADEGEGKSNIIANLAISFSQLSKRVLIIDGDMRCPTQAKIFGQDPHHVGLSELISGIENDVIIKDVYPGLDMITSGRIPPNPSELVTSPRFVEKLNEFRSQYDIMFIDFPPIGIVSDSVAVCKHISGYVFAIRSGRDSTQKVKNAIDTMVKLDAKIVGIVLNDYNIKGSGKYHYAASHYNQVNSRYARSAEKSRYEQSAERARRNQENGGQ